MLVRYPILKKFALLESLVQFQVRRDNSDDGMVTLNPGKYKINLDQFHVFEVSSEATVRQTDIDVQFMSALDGIPVQISGPLPVPVTQNLGIKFLNQVVMTAGLNNLTAGALGFGVGERWRMIRAYAKNLSASSGLVQYNSYDDGGNLSQAYYSMSLGGGAEMAAVAVDIPLRKVVALTDNVLQVNGLANPGVRYIFTVQRTE